MVVMVVMTTTSMAARVATTRSPTRLLLPLQPVPWTAQASGGTTGRSRCQVGGLGEALVRRGRCRRIRSAEAPSALAVWHGACRKLGVGRRVQKMAGCPRSSLRLAASSEALALGKRQSRGSSGRGMQLRAVIHRSRRAATRKKTGGEVAEHKPSKPQGRGRRRNDPGQQCT